MRTLTSVIIFLISSLTLYAQFGGQSQQVENLRNLAKTWGFIKYHHPDVQTCFLNWDKILLRSLEELDGADQSDYHQIVEDLIGRAGPIDDLATERPADIEEEESNNLDFNWIADSNFNDPIKQMLMDMVMAMRRNNHCLYEPLYEGVSLDFSFEKAYADLGNYPDKYHRALAFFRYWNVIDYFFPYKHIMDQDWDTTFDQFVLPVINSVDAETYHSKFREFTAYINDSHSFFNSPTFGSLIGGELLPFKINYVEGKTVITDLAEPGKGLEVGDIILELDNTPITELRNNLRKYSTASNEVTTERNINRNLIKSPETELSIKVMKANGEEVTVDSLQRSSSKYRDFHFRPSTESAWKTIATNACGEIGYVDMGLLKTVHIPDMIQDLWKKETIIFDIRNYPNATLWELVHFLFNKPIHIADFTVPYEDYAGQFKWNSEIIGSTNTNDIFEGKLIILFNEVTQSQAEYTIMGLEQHPNAVKIGSQTAAADGNISTISLPGGISAVFTGLGTYYPDRTPTQRIGIVPDIEIKPSIEGIRNGLDEVLELALDCKKIDEITSTETISNQVELSIFPNPIQNFIYLNKQDNIKEIDLIVYDISGKAVIRENVSDSLTTIDCSQLTTGYYMVAWKSEDDHNYKIQKLIKQ